jgi:hypothetical protein
VFSNQSLPASVKAFYWVWAFSFPYDYQYLPLPKEPTGLTFIGFWMIWLGFGGLIVIPLGAWIARKKID